jgi:hypothetical protein
MTVLTTSEIGLTLEDRCDKCSAAAMVRATLLNGQLFFCGHHAKELGATLILKSVEVYDPEKVLTNGN